MTSKAISKFQQVAFTALLTSLLCVPTLVSATNNDPFRGGREAVSPKPAVSVGESSGAMTYVYPLSIPPGRNGMQPDLSLSYSSADKRQDSIFGYGWSMSLPYIERVNKIGTNNLYNQDRDHTFFTSSLSGELLHVGSTVPVGGGFLANEESTPPLGFMEEPSEFSFLSEEPPSEPESSSVLPALSGVSDEVARSFHTFQNTFLPRRAFHPNYDEEFAASRAQAAQDAKAPLPAFRSQKKIV